VFNSYLVTQAGTAFIVGVLAVGLGQLIAINDRIADNMTDLLALIRPRDDEAAEAQRGEPAREAFDSVPSYDPRRDPRIVKEGTYRSRTVLTLEDGSVVIETPAGWKRFRTIREYDRLLPA
jgi:hypothetical protein